MSRRKRLDDAEREPTAEQVARYNSRYTRRGADDCWEWQALTGPKGYGIFSWNDVNYPAHRIALIWRDKIDPAGVHCCHRCDNPPCVNPKHLYWGTLQQNMQDKVDRDRHLYGERMPNSKLTEENVTYIWETYYARQASYDQLMEMYGVCRAVIDRIILKKTWTHVTSRLAQPPVFPMPAWKARGTRHGMSVLDERKVRMIRSWYKQKKSIASMARQLGVGESTIRNVVQGNTWAHVKDL